MYATVRAFLTWIVVSVPLTGSLAAQDMGGSLLVGGVQLRLGMPKQQVLDTLTKHHRLSITGEDEWVIITKEGPPFETVGGVAFRSGKLSWISRQWENFPQGDAVRLANELYRALESLTNGDAAPVLVTIHRSPNQPGFQAAQIEFRTGSRNLSLIVTEGRANLGGNQVLIQESVGGP